MSSRVIRSIVVAALLGLFLGVLIFIVWYDAEEGCSCSSKEPVRYKAAPNIKSSNSRSIANFLGYFKYLKQDEDNYTRDIKYLPLQLKSIRVEEEANHIIPVILEADCAILTIEMMKTKKDWTMGRVIAKPKLTDPNLVSYQNCTIEKDIQLSYPLTQHYSCHVPKSYSCNENEETILNKTLLYIEHLEFELHGDPEIISMGIFSTSGFGCAKPANHTQVFSNKTSTS